MELIKKPSLFLSYVMIFVGTGVLAVSIKNFYDPIGLVTGGFSGLSIVVKAMTANIIKSGIPLWLTNIALNVPVFIMAYVMLGKKFVGRTLFGTVMLSVWLYVIPPIDLTNDDYLLAAIFGAVFSGGGIGVVLRGHATTGGTDMVATLIKKKVLKHYSVAQIMLFLDGIIVCTGLFWFGLKATMYAIIAIVLTTKVTDTVLEGFNYSKAAFIISDKYDEIAKKIMEEVDRGVTGLYAKGMYTDTRRVVLYCVVSRREIVEVEEIVARTDPDAFMIVNEVREVLGEGFLEYNQFI